MGQSVQIYVWTIQKCHHCNYLLGTLLILRKLMFLTSPSEPFMWEQQVCRMIWVFRPFPTSGDAFCLYSNLFYVKRSVKSNRTQLLVRLPGYTVGKPPPASRILFEHPLLTVINVHINTRRAGRRCMLFSRAQHTVVPPQNTQTACIIAHQLTMQPFIVPGKTHPSMCTRALTKTSWAPRPAPWRLVSGRIVSERAAQEGPAGGCMMKTTRCVMSSQWNQAETKLPDQQRCRFSPVNAVSPVINLRSERVWVWSTWVETFIPQPYLNCFVRSLLHSPLRMPSVSRAAWKKTL